MEIEITKQYRIKLNLITKNVAVVYQIINNLNSVLNYNEGMPKMPIILPPRYNFFAEFRLLTDLLNDCFLN